VSTLFARRRPLPDIKSRIPQLAAQSERMAINHPIQGTAADLIKLAMVAVNKHLHTTEFGDSVRMLLQVHDELVFEVPVERVASAAELLAHIMETVHTFDVPLVVDAKAGINWANMQSVARTGST
jgi:DNA polymerase-1